MLLLEIKKNKRLAYLLFTLKGRGVTEKEYYGSGLWRKIQEVLFYLIQVYRISRWYGFRTLEKKWVVYLRRKCHVQERGEPK
ncbi:hypothetical protein ACN2C3_03390 [Aliarcobacter butzleri]